MLLAIQWKNTIPHASHAKDTVQILILGIWCDNWFLPICCYITDNDRLASLEAALEAAAAERQEILLAAEQEIEYHRSIAAELERSMMEDFDWKVHEIEADYHRWGGYSANQIVWQVWGILKMLQ